MVKTIIDIISKLKSKLLELANLNIPIFSGIAGLIGGALPGGNSSSAKNSTSHLGEWVGSGQPGYAMGTDYVPYTGLFQLHKGEAVIPANENKAPGVINLYLSDGSQIAQWVMGQMENQFRLRGAY